MFRFPHTWNFQWQYYPRWRFPWHYKDYDPDFSNVEAHVSGIGPFQFRWYQTAADKPFDWKKK